MEDASESKRVFSSGPGLVERWCDMIVGRQGHKRNSVGSCSLCHSGVGFHFNIRSFKFGPSSLGMKEGSSLRRTRCGARASRLHQESSFPQASTRPLRSSSLPYILPIGYWFDRVATPWNWEARENRTSANREKPDPKLFGSRKKPVAVA